MSGQEKRQDAYEYGHVASSAQVQEAPYQTYGPPQFALQAPQTHMATPYGPVGHHPQFNYALQPDPYHGQQISYMENPPRLRPEITAYRPGHGSAGTTITIHLRSNLDLAAFQPPLGCTVFFRDSGVPGALTRMNAHDHGFHYTVAANVPGYESKQWMETVPLYLSINDMNGQHINFIYIGDFVYDIPQGSSRQSPSPGLSQKRKTPVDEAIAHPAPKKRPSLQQLHDGEDGQRGMLPLNSTRPIVSPSQADQKQSLAMPFTSSHTPDQHYSRAQHLSPSQPARQTVASAPYMSQAHLSAQKSWPPSPKQKSRSRSPGGSSNTSNSNPHPARTGTTSEAPALIRTSTLHTHALTNAYDARPSQSFNPYSIYPNKAILNLQGNLDDMADNWDREEWDSHRRLVEFQRVQEDNTIIASFQAVKPEARTPKSICVSCIWWEEKQEAFVTSVDTIFLLESLVAVRFTVEEKNRIRRNLEGFRPLTVSKGKSESEEFFKIIMGFPNPKPRNIEKDVKVFPWKILSHALKKIIGKYSASYASTAGTLLPQAGTDRNSNTPQSSPNSTSSSPPPLASIRTTHPATQTHMSPATAMSGPHLDSSLHPRIHDRYIPHAFPEQQQQQQQQQQQAYSAWMAQHGHSTGVQQYHMSTPWEQFGVLPNTTASSQAALASAPQDYSFGHFMGAQDGSRLPSDPSFDPLNQQNPSS